MAITSLHSESVSATPNRPDILDDLGSMVLRMHALLKASISMEHGEEEEAAWLVSIAYEQAIDAKALFMSWALPDEQPK